MIQPRILVTAATGNTGYPTALQLVERGFLVRALVRARSERSAALEAAGVEVVIGEMTAQADVARALTDVQRAYLCLPWGPQMLSAGLTFAVAAAATHLESMVLMGQWLSSPDHPSFATRQVWLLEQSLSMMPHLAVTVVNPGWFADNYMQLLETIAQLGVMPLPLGHGLNAPPSNEDIARVVAGVLSNPEPHAGKTYRPTGPRLLTPEEIAATFARVLKRPVRYIDIPDWVMLKALRALGLPAFQQAQVRFYVRDYRSNAFGVGAPTTAVREVSGAEPEDFETICRRYVAHRPEASRNLVNWLRAMANFARIPLTPALNFERLHRIQELPEAQERYFAMDSPAWLSQHQKVSILQVPRLPPLENRAEELDTVHRTGCTSRGRGGA